jgi:hypothetical protein
MDQIKSLFFQIKIKLLSVEPVSNEVSEKHSETLEDDENKALNDDLNDYSILFLFSRGTAVLVCHSFSK